MFLYRDIVAYAERRRSIGRTYTFVVDLEKAFRSEAVNAKTIYIHDASDGDSPLPGVKFQLMTDAQHPMIHAVTFDLNKNIRLISFEEADGRIYVLLLMWDQTVDPDKKIGVVSDMTKYKGKEKLKVNGD